MSCNLPPVGLANVRVKAGSQPEGKPRANARPAVASREVWQASQVAYSASSGARLVKSQSQVGFDDAPVKTYSYPVMAGIGGALFQSSSYEPPPTQALPGSGSIRARIQSALTVQPPSAQQRIARSPISSPLSSTPTFIKHRWTSPSPISSAVSNSSPDVSVQRKLITPQRSPAPSRSPINAKLGVQRMISAPSAAVTRVVPRRQSGSSVGQKSTEAPTTSEIAKAFEGASSSAAEEDPVARAALAAASLVQLLQQRCDLSREVSAARSDGSQHQVEALEKEVKGMQKQVEEVAAVFASLDARVASRAESSKHARVQEPAVQAKELEESASQKATAADAVQAQEPEESASQKPTAAQAAGSMRCLPGGVDQDESVVSQHTTITEMLSECRRLQELTQDNDAAVLRALEADSSEGKTESLKKSMEALQSLQKQSKQALEGLESDQSGTTQLLDKDTHIFTPRPAQQQPVLQAPQQAASSGSASSRALLESDVSAHLPQGEAHRAAAAAAATAEQERAKAEKERMAAWQKEFKDASPRSRALMEERLVEEFPRRIERLEQHVSADFAERVAKVEDRVAAEFPKRMDQLEKSQAVPEASGNPAAKPLLSDQGQPRANKETTLSKVRAIENRAKLQEETLTYLRRSNKFLTILAIILAVVLPVVMWCAVRASGITEFQGEIADHSKLLDAYRQRLDSKHSQRVQKFSSIQQSIDSDVAAWETWTASVKQGMVTESTERARAVEAVYPGIKEVSQRLDIEGSDRAETTKKANQHLDAKLVEYRRDLAHHIALVATSLSTESSARAHAIAAMNKPTDAYTNNFTWWQPVDKAILQMHAEVINREDETAAVSHTMDKWTDFQESLYFLKNVEDTIRDGVCAYCMTCGGKWPQMVGKTTRTFDRIGRRATKCHGGIQNLRGDRDVFLCCAIV